MLFGFPRIYLNKPFEVNNGNKEAWKAAESIVKGETQKGLLLTGESGIGKTHLAAWTFVEWSRKNKSEEVEFVNYPYLIMRMQYHIEVENFKNEWIIDDMIDAKLLVLDDIGSEKTSAWNNSILYTIINYRYERMKLTLVTSNFHPQVLATRIGDNIVSRLIEMCQVVKIISEDRRIKH